MIKSLEQLDRECQEKREALIAEEALRARMPVDPWLVHRPKTPHAWEDWREAGEGIPAFYLGDIRVEVVQAFSQVTLIRRPDGLSAIVETGDLVMVAR